MCTYFMIYLHIKVHVSSYDISLVINVKSKAETDLSRLSLLFYILQKVTFFMALK